MPELPEVETTLRGIQSHIKSKQIKQIVIRNHNLRWPIPNHLSQTLKNVEITQLIRRGKYLLFVTPIGTLIVHLGMSGSLRILFKQTPPKKHDHVDIEFPDNVILRFTDPRRFGAILWITTEVYQHPLLINLGPEPLEKSFNTTYLWGRIQNKKVAIKPFLMNNHNVVGVGNIYATEALFAAGINPFKPAGKLTIGECKKLVLAIKNVLRAAIKQGGTSLRDFVHSDGKLGYFKHRLKVYGRAKKPCLKCKTKLINLRIGQRSSVYCESCQK